ncbi:hypothetical protein BZA70DRAFT_284097 [Myxozyma melibiosi]|uniref:Putative lipoate-protein ligase A n=1 Tax=Myxozyma melibiosi TaxID=54550 RepID=A0ABR1F025_9ASCO
MAGSCLYLFRRGIPADVKWTAAKRLLTTAAGRKYNLSVFISNSKSPHFNLSFEDYLFQKYPPSSSPSSIPAKYLLLYTNTPCVIIGRNQNPHRETAVAALRTHGIPLVRRKSGGGAVFHDLGNVNYCVMMPNGDFDRDEHALAICDAVARIGGKGEEGGGVRLEVNERHDIVDCDGKKVSGSAYKLQRGKAYHHGTMLLNSKLHILSEVLHSSSEYTSLQQVEGAGVQSVKSPVANVGVESEAFVEAVVKLFRERYTDGGDGSFSVRFLDEKSLLPDEQDEVLKRVDELQSWKWTFGSTPKFTHKFLLEKDGPPALTFAVKEGTILAVDSTLPESEVVADEMVGKMYRAEEIEEFVPSGYWRDRIRNSI